MKTLKKWNWSVFLFIMLVCCLGALARKDASTEKALFITVSFGIPIGLLWAWLAKEE